ncbi:hypothetical protein B0293_23785 [Amycolatopsis azurea DSM 43854]|uniref:Phage protein n=1 Tax=Amycolatopsis azurea DSM 43854 TaxID=1238180 RepID=M2QA40_9PSEU|nr:hypothetical protein C791_7917 [Amycolatopsis azurea DSM 43854]OOC04280.1 hypothetical protein B0293_23785 [Amycolatopsis azurea DSM 43854]
MKAAAAAAVDQIDGLRCFPFVPDAISPPAFFVAEVEVEYDATFGRGMDTVYLTCRLLVSHATDRTGQEQLDGYLRGAGPRSVKTVLEADPSLGGVCDAVRVQRVSGYGLYEHNGNQFYGAEWRVLIIGRGD